MARQTKADLINQYKSNLSYAVHNRDASMICDAIQSLMNQPVWYDTHMKEISIRGECKTKIKARHSCKVIVELLKESGASILSNGVEISEESVNWYANI